MKLRTVVGAILACGLALIPATADAKGVEQVTLSGPGLATPIQLGAEGSNRLADAAGLYAALRDTTSPSESTQPPAELGPRYIATYTYGAPEQQTERRGTLRQDLYPFAADGPVAYTPPGQKYFQTTSQGAWHRDERLAMLLVAAGVPAPASAASSAPQTAVDATPQLTG